MDRMTLKYRRSKRLSLIIFLFSMVRGEKKTMEKMRISPKPMTRAAICQFIRARAENKLNSQDSIVGIYVLGLAPRKNVIARIYVLGLAHKIYLRPRCPSFWVDLWAL